MADNSAFGRDRLNVNMLLQNVIDLIDDRLNSVNVTDFDIKPQVMQTVMFYFCKQSGIDNTDESCDYATGIEPIPESNTGYCGYPHAGS